MFNKVGLFFIAIAVATANAYPSGNLPTFSIYPPVGPEPSVSGFPMPSSVEMPAPPVASFTPPTSAFPAPPSFPSGFPSSVVEPPMLRRGSGSSQCNTGALQCCTAVQNATSTPMGDLLEILSIVIPNPDVDVGINCSPLTVIGTGSGSSCSATPVCCESNEDGGLLGLIGINCNPVDLISS